MRVFILKEGKEYNQGVAYLDDGTMVVVDNAKKMISKTIDISVTSVLQTTAGKMIFGKYDDRQSRGEPSCINRRFGLRTFSSVVSRSAIPAGPLTADGATAISMSVLAIIPAAGVGVRMGGATPKQFLSLEGVPIFVHTLRKFVACEIIDEIFWACAPKIWSAPRGR